MRGEFPLSTLFLQELGELGTGVLPATVGPKAFDPDSVLCLCPHRKGFVGVERLVFCSQDLEPGVASVIIGKCDIILVPPQARDRGWPP
jgi:hypothetical protein